MNQHLKEFLKYAIKKKSTLSQDWWKHCIHAKEDDLGILNTHGIF